MSAVDKIAHLVAHSVESRDHLFMRDSRGWELCHFVQPGVRRCARQLFLESGPCHGRDVQLGFTCPFGKVAIVTGASSGLGVAFAKVLAEAASGRRAIAVQTDVADPADCQRLVDDPSSSAASST